MYFHLDPLFLDEHPWVGVLIGVVGLIMASAMTVVMANEYWQYRSQGGPIPFAVDDLATMEEGTRVWAVVSGGERRCDLAAEQHRGIPDRWILGKVESTEVPILTADHSRVVIAEFSGRIDCEAEVGPNLEGVLTPARDTVYGHRSADLRGLGDVELVAGFIVGGGPSEARNYALFSAVFFAGMVWFTLHFLRKWLRKRELARDLLRQIQMAGKKPFEPR
jgi:hypothetical protein